MTAVPITITTAGLAELVAAGGGGTSTIAIAAVGVTASIFTPDPSMTTLPGEIKRVATISGGVIAPAVIHLGMRDDSTDAYTMNSFGLYLADGTLFGIYSQSAAIYTKTAGSVGLLACDIAFVEGAASAVTFGATGFLNPPASTSVMGVVQLATNAEAIAGTNASDVLTPASGLAAFTAWIGGTVSAIQAWVLAQLATYATSASVTGLLASEFTYATDGSGNWKETRPNGVIEMGGYVAGPFTSEQTLTLTLPFGGFPNHIRDFSASTVNTSGTLTGDTQVQEVSLTRTVATIYIQAQGGAFYDAGGYRWRARGD